MSMHLGAPLAHNNAVTHGPGAAICPQCGSAAAVHSIEELAAMARSRLGQLPSNPAAANQRAIRCYAAVGFRPVGVMRQYERGRDGQFHDGLLMDLLRDELVPPR